MLLNFTLKQKVADVKTPATLETLLQKRTARSSPPPTTAGHRKNSERTT